MANINAIRGFQFSFFGEGVGNGVVKDQGFGFSPMLKVLPAKSLAVLPIVTM